jgi:uncharacterized DUF497 family protein
MALPPLISQAEGFDWQKDIIDKIIRKHGVDPDEVEECFYNENHKLRRAQDELYYLYGQSDSGRYLFVVYAWKQRLIRIISARDMTAKERSYYKRK